MLNKEVCRKCIEFHSRNLYTWGYEDEYRWELGLIWCYVNTRIKYMSILELPPNNCYFYTEQLILGQD